MPKPIKKKVRKKTPEEEVKSIYEIFSNYYERNKNFVHLAIATVMGLIIVVFAGLWYFKSSSKKAVLLEYEGYKYLNRLYDAKDLPEEQALQKALEKFMASYRKDPSAIKLLYIANTQYRLKQFDDAMESLKQLIEQYPDSKELVGLAYYKLAMIQLKRGQKQEAINTLKKLYETEGLYLRDLALYESAQLLESEGNKDEALKQYRILTKTFPGSPYAKLAMAKLKATEEKQTDKEKESPTPQKKEETTEEADK